MQNYTAIWVYNRKCWTLHIAVCVLCTVYPAVKWGPGFGWGMAKPPTVSIASCGQGGATGTPHYDWLAQLVLLRVPGLAPGVCQCRPRVASGCTIYQGLTAALNPFAIFACVCVCVCIEETKENPELVLLCERFVKVLLTVLCITTTHLHTTSSYAWPRGGR